MDIKNKSEVEFYLKSKGLLDMDDVILTVEIPGQGNMNLVVRVITIRKSLIVKQAKPYVVKYPQIAAPEDRILVEGAFYNIATTEAFVNSMMPELYYMDAESKIIVFEDLGENTDFTHLFNLENRIAENELIKLVQYLDRLHHAFLKEEKIEILNNDAMRKLNHEHLFYFPFLEENGFDLDSVTPGLQAIALKYKTDETLKATIATLGDRYLAKGDFLLHGDYYPGSWLDTTSVLKIIDPEFCFYGFREFDLGVMYAHLLMTGHGEVELETIKKVYSHFDQIDEVSMMQYCGVEIMRRLIGLAQIPLKADLSIKKELLQKAHHLINQ